VDLLNFTGLPSPRDQESRVWQQQSDEEIAMLRDAPASRRLRQLWTTSLTDTRH
jgi:hypothetical protein